MFILYISVCFIFIRANYNGSSVYNIKIYIKKIKRQDCDVAMLNNININKANLNSKSSIKRPLVRLPIFEKQIG